MLPKVWFTKKLEYVVNDSIPVKPNYKKGATPSDIDLVCKHPRMKKQDVTFEDGRTIKLSPNLLVECKGWFDYPKTEFMKHLEENLTLLKRYGKRYIPKNVSRRDTPHMFFFREEV